MVTRHTPAVMIDEGLTRQPLETFTVKVVLGSAGTEANDHLAHECLPDHPVLKVDVAWHNDD